jgi:hypothetical protein
MKISSTNQKHIKYVFGTTLTAIQTFRSII